MASHRHLLGLYLRRARIDDYDGARFRNDRPRS